MFTETVLGFSIGLISTTVYLNLYVFVLFNASVTVIVPTRVPKVAVSVEVLAGVST